MKTFLLSILILIGFSFTNLVADQWDGFFKASGFPRKIIDNGSVIKGQIYDAMVTYQISNNDGIKGNFENNDTAKVTIVNRKGKLISTKKFMNATELRIWGRENFTEIFSAVIGDKELNKETISELTRLASLVLLNQKLD